MYIFIDKKSVAISILISIETNCIVFFLYRRCSIDIVDGRDSLFTFFLYNKTNNV